MQGPAQRPTTTTSTTTSTGGNGGYSITESVTVIGVSSWFEIWG